MDYEGLIKTTRTIKLGGGVKEGGAVMVPLIALASKNLLLQTVKFTFTLSYFIHDGFKVSFSN